MEEAINLCAVRDRIPFPKLLSNMSMIKDAVNEVISELWYEQRGMVIESIALIGLTLDKDSRARVEQFDSAKIFADDPEALNALVALGFTEAMKSAASNQAGATGGFAGLGLAGSYSADAATADNQGIPAGGTCPFCGTPLPSQVIFEHCPACNADIRSCFPY